MLGRSAATPGRSPRAPVKLKPAKRRTEPEPAEESADHGDKTAVPPPTVPEKRTASQRDADSESEDEIAQYDSSESKKATPEKIKINWRVKLQPASRSKSGAKPPLPPAGTPKKDTTATPRKEPVSARKPSAAVEDKEAGGRTVTPRKGGLASGATSAAGTPSRNVRFTADTKPPASKPSKDTKDPVSSSPDEKSARVTRSQTTITPTKPSQSASKPGQTLITPTKSPSIPSMRTPRTPRITGRPTRDLLSNLNLTDAFSARVQEKAMSLYERYISRRNQGRSHGFPSAGFVEVACIDLACDFCGEKNEQFALLIGHAQLGKEELARQLYPGYKKELERYLDVPPSARKTRQAVRDEDEDEEQTERLRPSDLSALINRLGIPEVKEDVVELLSIYAKGLKGVAAGDRDKWVWGPAVVGGAVKSVGEAWGKRIASGVVARAMPSTSLLLTNKHVDRQAKLISEDARCLKFLERLAELHATDRTRGKKKEENKSSLPKPLNVPAGMTIQEARKARLAAQEPEEEEKEERKVPVARFGKKTKEEAAAQEQAKGSPEKNTSPVKRRKTRSVFDKMKKEKKWVTGINPMIPHTELLDLSNPRSKLNRLHNEVLPKLRKLLAKWKEVWDREKDDESDEEEDGSEAGEEDVQDEVVEMEVDA